MSKINAYTRSQNVVVKAPVLNLKLTVEQAAALLADVNATSETSTAVTDALSAFVAAN